MRTYYITFRSVTFAQRGEGLLSAAGLRCSIGRTPRWMEEQGCGYALKVRTKDIREAVELLREQKVPLRRVYEGKDGGKMEEVTLL